MDHFCASRVCDFFFVRTFFNYFCKHLMQTLFASISCKHALFFHHFAQALLASTFCFPRFALRFLPSFYSSTFCHHFLNFLFPSFFSFVCTRCFQNTFPNHFVQSFFSCKHFCANMFSHHLFFSITFCTHFLRSVFAVTICNHLMLSLVANFFCNHSLQAHFQVFNHIFSFSITFYDYFFCNRCLHSLFIITFFIHILRSFFASIFSIVFCSITFTQSTRFNPSSNHSLPSTRFNHF